MTYRQGPPVPPYGSPERDPDAGTVLGEKDRQLIRSVAVKALRGDPDAADAVTHALEPVIAFLISAAREAGQEEGRAAQEWPDADQPASYLGGSYTTPVPRWDQRQ